MKRKTAKEILADSFRELPEVFENSLPEDWRCPRCKQPKEKFNRA